MADLQVLTIDGTSMNNPIYSAGTNIQIDANGEISLVTSPALSGTPTAPTNGTASTSNTQIATTAFVQNAINRRLGKTENVYYNIPSTAIATGGNPTKKQTFWTNNTGGGGLLIARVYISFVANATGYRQVNVNRTRSGADTAIGSNLRVMASPNGVTALTVPIVARTNAGDSYCVYIGQSSGASINYSGSVVGYFIPD